ncbi:hypothetical protein L2E82_49764 [Cichorium intybus]|uniref:Uncharacterized protein n=1 Tax=Cichorium intybus TaxID=13427 RepID=A0ACB8Z5B7_CICIN|nr:hypothetical protein L2E82_49764 [Cichorium intybus]
MELPTKNLLPFLHYISALLLQHLNCRGMLVQKQDPDAETNPIPPPTIRVRVKYEAIYHEININSQATFGESLISPLCKSEI